jgi:iron(III) transport system ATP-binding protein
VLKVTALYTEYQSGKGPAVKAAQDVSFEVPPGKLFTLLGPSGCGKTTTLRSIAGLERPVSGDIEVAGKPVYSSSRGIFVQPNKRNFGMVFQSYAIWPHMNVFENAAFPLRVGRSGLSRAALQEKVTRVLAAVGLDHLAGRESTRLSGGQQQRLALARALVMEPQLLLLDEPLSNLDSKLREKMRFELKRIQDQLGLTTIYVTHDQGEALALSHQIAVMSEGRIVQIGTPREIYERPRTRFVADFIGSTNFLDARLLSRDAITGLWQAETALGNFTVTAADTFASGDAVALSIRPEDVEVSTAEPTAGEGANIARGVVDQMVFLGDVLDLKVRVGDRLFQARTHPSTGLSIGAETFLRIEPTKCVTIPAD